MLKESRTLPWRERMHCFAAAVNSVLFTSFRRAFSIQCISYSIFPALIILPHDTLTSSYQALETLKPWLEPIVSFGIFVKLYTESTSPNPTPNKRNKMYTVTCRTLFLRSSSPYKEKLVTINKHTSFCHQNKARLWIMTVQKCNFTKGSYSVFWESLENRGHCTISQEAVRQDHKLSEDREKHIKLLWRMLSDY